MVAFEIILAILTAGAGTAIGAAAKSKHLAKAGTTLQKASKLLRRKRLHKTAKQDLTPDANLDKQIDKPKVVLEETSHYARVRQAKTPTQDEINSAKSTGETAKHLLARRLQLTTLKTMGIPYLKYRMLWAPQTER